MIFFAGAPSYGSIMDSAAKKPRIAVVDDDASVRTATASMLRSAGYAVAVFDTAEAFLFAGHPHRFACVIADLQMPGMGGIALADRLGRDAPDAPVILVTGKRGQEALGRAAATSAAFVLQKPFPAERLLACVQIAMGRPFEPQPPIHA